MRVKNVYQCKIIRLDQFIKAYCCLLLYVFSLLTFTIIIILSLMLHMLLPFSDHGIFSTNFKCDKHIYANYLYVLNLHVKMTSERSKRLHNFYCFKAIKHMKQYFNYDVNPSQRKGFPINV